MITVKIKANSYNAKHPSQEEVRDVSSCNRKLDFRFWEEVGREKLSSCSGNGLNVVAPSSGALDVHWCNFSHAEICSHLVWDFGEHGLAKRFLRKVFEISEGHKLNNIADRFLSGRRI